VEDAEVSGLASGMAVGRPLRSAPYPDGGRNRRIRAAAQPKVWVGVPASGGEPLDVPPGQAGSGLVGSA